MAADPETGIITDEKLTRAAGQENADPAVAAEFVAAEAAGAGHSGAAEAPAPGRRRTVTPLAWYGDSAYGTGELRDAIGGAGHQAVIKPKPVQPAVPGGFTFDDFTVDEQAGTVTCPAGITRRSPPATPSSSAPPAAPARCAGCTTSKSGRTLSLHPHDRLLRAARADWAARPGCARTTWHTGPTSSASSPRSPPGAAAGSSSATAGSPQNHAWLKRRTAALNLRNLVGRGLTRRDGTWVLAT